MTATRPNRSRFTGVLRHDFKIALRGSLALCLLLCALSSASAQETGPLWTFAVSGDSRNCGDFVMPAIAARVKAQKDAFYWHLGDFRWMSSEDEDMAAMQTPGVPMSKPEYQQRAWDDFLANQIAAFDPVPVFLGRGNHETVPPMTREGYVKKFSDLLDRPEIEAQRKQDGPDALAALGARPRSRSALGRARHCGRNARGSAALHRFRACHGRLGPRRAHGRTGLPLALRRAGCGQARLRHGQPFALRLAQRVQHLLLEGALQQSGSRLDSGHRGRAPL